MDETAAFYHLMKGIPSRVAQLSSYATSWTGSAWGAALETLPTEHAWPNTGRWIGSLWHNGKLVSAERFTSWTHARRWANRSRDVYGAGMVRVVPYRARVWKRVSPEEAELLRIRNIINKHKLKAARL